MGRIKPVFKCDDKFKEKFKDSRCALTISVGQEVHEGEKLEATLNLVNCSFKSCIIFLDDTLQRYSIALGKKEDADFFYETARKEGDAWLKRNDKYLKKTHIIEKITRWSPWLQHPEYTKYKNKIITLLDIEPLFKQKFDETINKFLLRYTQRQKKLKNPFDMEAAYYLCFNYLAEECAVFCLRVELNCAFEIYPSKRNIAMTETHKRFILPNNPNILNPVALKFKIRQQYDPNVTPKLQTEYLKSKERERVYV